MGCNGAYEDSYDMQKHFLPLKVSFCLGDSVLCEEGLSEKCQQQQVAIIFICDSKAAHIHYIAAEILRQWGVEVF